MAGVLLAVYALSNSSAFYTIIAPVNVDIRFGYLTPLLFAAAPTMGLIIMIRAKLLRRTDRYIGLWVWILGLYALTYGFVLWAFFKNVCL
jgi:hypothetical protein